MNPIFRVAEVVEGLVESWFGYLGMLDMMEVVVEAVVGIVEAVAGNIVVVEEVVVDRSVEGTSVFAVVGADTSAVVVHIVAVDIVVA